MRSLVGIGLLSAGVLFSAPAAAQDVEALRQELQQMRRQFETIVKATRRRSTGWASGSSSSRASPSRRWPRRPPPPRPPSARRPRRRRPRPPSPRSTWRGRASPSRSTAAAGPGQLLFDIGVAGDFIANLTQRNVDKANAGTFAGQENRFFPREIELALFGQIDPYARGEVRIEAGEEDAGRDRTSTSPRPT